MEQIMEITGVVLALLGALVFAAAAFGLLKFTDPYTRISAVGTAGGLGMILVVTGALLMMPSVADLVKVVLIIVLQLGAAAIGTMALARAAYLTNVPLKPGHYDELAEDTASRSAAGVRDDSED